MAGSEFQDILKKFRALAGGRSYARGEEYFEEGSLLRYEDQEGRCRAR